jgi:folate-dependent phosphoribosylglycinamide formyltransferase PurN
MKKILFLGYSQNETKIIEKLKENKNYQIFNTKNKIKLKNIDNINFVISFGYKHVINEDILKKKKNIINLHISYLPYNRGAHPNFWSFAENTPSGITINKINKGIDTGNIIYQKLLDFELNKNRRKLTFKKTYSTLISEIENLFIINSKNLLNNEYEEFEQIGNGTYHNSNELPAILKSWNQNIFNTINKYNKKKNDNIKKKLKLLNEIENTRKKNNVNWMNILRLSIKKTPSKTLKILNSINADDDAISKLFKKINEK